MKTVKYRSWNEQAKCFIYFVNGLYYDADGNQGCFAFNWENVEQFVGKNNKNDKEIYNGDIVVCTYGKYDLEKEGLTRIGKIIYDDRTASFKVNVKDSAVLVGFYDINKIEKIGNIHENPELMK
jgi:hypothetical protein